MIRVLAAIIACAPASVFAETLTAARLVRPNTVLSAADLVLSDTVVPGALTSGATVVGMEARVTLYPGHAIRPEDVGPAALIERNQTVTLIYQSGGLLIAAEARSLSRGAAGDVVKAINLSSRTTVTGRVLPNGTIAVSF